MGPYENWDDLDNYASIVKLDNENILVAQDDAEIIGVVLLTFFGSKVAWIFRLAVKEAYREKGIGSKLIEEAEKIVRKKGVKELGLYANASNMKLQSFYKKRKYKTFGKEYIYMWKLM